MVAETLHADAALDTPLQAALAYVAEFGWSVIPIDPQSKRPLVAWEAFQREPADDLTIGGWYRRWPAAGVGIVTGSVSDLWVVDVDAQEGFDALEALTLPDGPMVKTGKGMHRYYRLPAALRNTARRVPGLDTRGEGGYVIAPPSRHPSGRQYAWSVSPYDAPIPAAPPDLVRLFTVADARQGGAGSGAGSGADDRPETDFVGLLRHGAPHGARNDSLARLAGHLLAHRLPEEEVAELLMPWAERCTPPLPLLELRASVKSIARAEERKQAAGLFDVDSDTPWPKLDPQALYGLAGDIVRAIEPHSEADTAALLINTLVCFGNAAGRSTHGVAAGSRHGLNLFAAIVGDTGSGRKGSSLGYVRRLFALAASAWSDKNVLSGLSSGEGVISAVKDDEMDDCAVDPVQRDKRVLVIEEELATVMKVMRREGNILSGIIRQAWDGNSLHLMTKAQVTARDPHISILAHVTPTELRKLLSETEASNGFANRFLWVCSRQSKYLADGGGLIDFTELYTALGAALDWAAREERTLKRDRAASIIWNEVYRDLSDRPLGLLGVVTNRAAAQVFRLSMVYAALAQSAAIREEHLMAALALWDYCEKSARYIFGDATGDPTMDAILDALATAGGEGMDRTAISAIFGRHIPARERARAIQALEKAGRIERVAYKTGGADRLVFRLKREE